MVQGVYNTSRVCICMYGLKYITGFTPTRKRLESQSAGAEVRFDDNQ